MTQGNFSFNHRRSHSGSYAPKLRTARPALHRKGTSFVNHSISKLGAGHTRHSESDNDCQSEMAASFLNFWYVSLISDRSMSSWFLIPWPYHQLSPCILEALAYLKSKLTHFRSAMCERQITIPDNSRLYCSERYVARLILSLSSFALAQPPCFLFISRSAHPNYFTPIYLHELLLILLF